MFDFFLKNAAQASGEPPQLDFSDPAAMTDFAQYYATQSLDKIIEFTPRLLMALIILWIGFWLAGKISRAIKKQVAKNDKVDSTLGNFFAAVARYTIMIGTLLAAIGMIGVPVAKVFVILSAATLAIGLALQGSLGNVAAGLLLIIQRPFQVGDYIEAGGEEGTVEDLNVFTTTLRTLDNIQIILSNGEVRSNTIKNYTTLGLRRCDVDFGIDYDDDMDKAIKIITETAAKDDRVLTKPDGPWARVSNLGGSSVDIQMRVWCHPDHYWDVRFDLIKAVKEAFDAGGISIPYPHVVEIEKD